MDKVHRINSLNTIKDNIKVRRDNMLFIPQEQVKKTLKRLRKEGKERRRIESEKRKAAYLKAKEEGKLDEYYAEIERKWNELHPPKKEFRKTISNIGDGNMKIIEDYAKRKVDESKEPIVTILKILPNIFPIMQLLDNQTLNTLKNI